MSAHDSMYFDGIHSSQFLKNREQKSAEQFTNTMTNHRFFFFQRTNVKNFFFGIPWVRRKSTLPPNLIISCSRRVQRTFFKENFRSHRRLSGREDFLSSNKKNTTRKGKLFAMIFQVQSWHDKSLIWKGKKSFARLFELQRLKGGGSFAHNLANIWKWVEGVRVGVWGDPRGRRVSRLKSMSIFRKIIGYKEEI